MDLHQVNRRPRTDSMSSPLGLRCDPPTVLHQVEPSINSNFWLMRMPTKRTTAS